MFSNQTTQLTHRLRGPAMVLAMALTASCSGPQAPHTPRVAIDPGHPSETSQGATGPGGASELHVNWVMSQRLKGLLEERGYEVVLTKLVEEELVTNRHRAEIGTYADADLMVRLHCDAGDHVGTATFYPDRQGTRWGVTGPTPEVMEASRALAEAFHPALIRALGPDWPDLGIKGDSRTAVGAVQGALTGSIFSRIPVVTLEMVVLTNPDQEAFITSEEGQERMAEAIVAGVDAYFSSR